MADKREKPLTVTLPAVGDVLPEKVVKRKPGRPPKHGAYDGTALFPLTVEKRAEIVDMMTKAGQPPGTKYMIAINLLAGNLAMLELINRAITVEGVLTVDKDGNTVPQPLLKVYWSALNSAMRQCAALNLTPGKLVAGGKGPTDLAAAMDDAREEEDDA